MTSVMEVVMTMLWSCQEWKCWWSWFRLDGDIDGNDIGENDGYYVIDYGDRSEDADFTSLIWVRVLEIDPKDPGNDHLKKF